MMRHCCDTVAHMWLLKCERKIRQIEGRSALFTYKNKLSRIFELFAIFLFFRLCQSPPIFYWFHWRLLMYLTPWTLFGSLRSFCSTYIDYYSFDIPIKTETV